MTILRWPRKKRSAPILAGYHLPQVADDLLSTPRRTQLLEAIWQRVSVSRAQFEQLYIKPLERYAELVQLLPASENHHHAHLGGMLDHGLEIVAYALKIRQQYLLPIGAPPESQAAQAEVWSVAAAYGALVHDLGKLAVDVKVELAGGELWHPWHGPIQRPYRFRYEKGRQYQLHGAASALVIQQILDIQAMDWLSGHPEAWQEFIYVLAGQYEHAGMLGQIVTQADSASVAQELGGNPDRAIQAPRQTLQRQLVDGLRMLVLDKFKLNHPDGPSDGWLTQDALWLVSKPVADQLRAFLLSQGIDGVPSSNSPLFNMLQDNAVIQPNGDKAIWKAAIDNGKGWKHTFTLLRLSPSLIWTSGGPDRPETFTGTVSPEVSAPESASHDQPQPQPEVLQMMEVGTGVTPEPGLTHRADPIQAPIIQREENDDLLALFDSIAMPSGQQAVLMGSERRPETTEIAAATEIAEPDVRAAEDETQSTEPHLPTASRSSMGQDFISWLKMGIASRKLIINDAKAMVHTTQGTAVLVSPAIFKRYAMEHPDLEVARGERKDSGWELVQRAFEKEKLHRKTPKSLNIWTFDVAGPRKTKQLRGYMLRDPHLIFPSVPYDNPAIALVEESAG